jgi:hypothetical protein
MSTASGRALDMVDVLLRQFEDVVLYLREADLPVDVLGNSNLASAYEEIKLLHGRLEHVQQMVARSPSPDSQPSTPSPSPKQIALSRSASLQLQQMPRAASLSSSSLSHPASPGAIASASASGAGGVGAGGGRAGTPGSPSTAAGGAAAAPAIAHFLRSVSASGHNSQRGSESGRVSVIRSHSPPPVRPMSTQPFDAASAPQVQISSAQPSMQTLADFEMQRVIGTGTFGTVQLAVHRASGTQFAIKVLDKNRVIATRQLQHLRYERQILSGISHPFIISVHCSMQDATNVYLVMDYVPGGELFEYIRRAGRFAEHEARFFAAEIVEALTHLHAFSIMYRDLKPENVLLDTTGHIKLIDFGFAKVMPPTARAYTMCGTPEYIAPEVILSRGHDAAVDWWSLGILIFEMLSGEPPFTHSERAKLFEAIVTGVVRFPVPISPDACSLILGLLKTQPSERLGNIQHGVDAIKNHAFFDGIDWNVVAQRGLVPPIRPQPTLYKFDALPPVQASLATYNSTGGEDVWADF